jgi:hypothetical protein
MQGVQFLRIPSRIENPRDNSTPPTKGLGSMKSEEDILVRPLS